MLGLLAGSGFLSVGCQRNESVQAYKTESDQCSQERSQKIDIEFYIDASRSMRGFHAETQPYYENHFIDLLSRIDGVLKTAWPSVEVHYWKFGGGAPQRISSIREFSMQSGLFTETTTRIDNAIHHDVKPVAGRSQIRIILTDLFQDEQDVGRLATELSNAYLHNEESGVGILGIRNAFSGPMFDLPGSLPNGGTDSLPFYLLVAGPVMDVHLAMETIAGHMKVDQLPDDKYLHVVFCRRPVPGLMQHLKVGAAPPRATGFTVSSSMVHGARELAIPQIAVFRREVRLKQSFYLSREDAGHVSRRPLGVVLKMEPSIWVWAPQRKEWVPAPAVAAEAFQLKSADHLNADTQDPVQSPNEGEADYLVSTGELTIDARSLPKNSIYLVRYDLLARKGEVSGVASWNLEYRDARRIVQNRQFERLNDGSRPGRTPSLRFFLQTISDATFQSDVLLAHYYLYVKVV